MGIGSSAGANGSSLLTALSAKNRKCCRQCNTKTHAGPEKLKDVNIVKSLEPGLSD